MAKELVSVSPKEVAIYGLKHPGMVSHPKELITELSKFAKGTRIALPGCPEHYDDGGEIKEQVANNLRTDLEAWRAYTPEYWRDLKRALEEGGYVVQLVGDLTSNKKYLQARNEADKVIQQFRDLKRNGTYPVVEGVPSEISKGLKNRELNERFFAQNVVANYEFSFGIAEALKRNVLASDAQVFVLPDYHAEAIQLASEDEHAFIFGVYRKEQLLHKYVVDSVPMNLDLRKKLAQRSIRAGKEWRVTDYPRPWGIGTYNTGCRPNGLFELHLRGGAPRGTFYADCEDLLGTAEVSGKIDRRRITFTKKYVPNESLLSSDKPYMIKYDGVSLDGGIKYEGIWSIKGDACGTFIYYHCYKDQFPYDEC